MWHASVSPAAMPYGAAMCERWAERELEGVGDVSLGEWREWTGRAFHLRRRLSGAEELLVGPVLDIRGTDEARRRLRPVRPILAAVGLDDGWEG